MIAVSDLGFSFGRQVLFEGANFQLNPGRKYGVVGANGSGKSTLLKILSGELAPEKGEVHRASAFRMGLLRQDHFAYEERAITDVVLMGRPILWQAIAAKRELEQAPRLDDRSGEKLAEMETTIADQNGYQAEAKACELLAGLGIRQEQMFRKLSTLSGGYKLRVLLAQCLFGRFDCLLLDEPTNHLDIVSIRWFEEYLANFGGMTFVISHDRHFLNCVSDHIVDIDYGTVRIYTGNYDAYIAAKELEREQKEAEILKQERKREELRRFVDRFKAKATKARQASSKKKLLSRIKEIEIERSSRIAPSFDFPIARPSGKMVLALKDLSKSFGSNRVLRRISHIVYRGDKIAVIGPNGIGKSTLIEIIAAKQQPTSGSAETGHEVAWSYLPQEHREVVCRDTTAYEWLYSFAPWEEIGTIRGLLGRVLISGDDVHKPTEALSGGESGRLIFAKIMLQKPNLLLLDEPTNHMDLETIAVLGEALKRYDGSIVCVSHNRQFIDSFANGILELTGEGFDFFPGGYAEYLARRGEDYLDRQALPAAVAKKKQSGGKTEKLRNRKRRELGKEVRKLERALRRKEAEIERLEGKIADLDLRLAQKETYAAENTERVRLIKSDKEQYAKLLCRVSEEWESCQTKLDELSSQLG